MARKLGIIAGAGKLPLYVARACQRQGRPYFVMAIEGHADPALWTSDMPVVWIRLGAIGSHIKLAKKNGVQDIVIIGAVKRPSLLELRPDLKGLIFLAKTGIMALGDDGLLRAVLKKIEQEGFKVIGADEVLKEMVAMDKIYGKLKPSKKAMADICKGFTVAKLIGQADIGQAVIIQDGLVLGVEAIEGTDALIARVKDLHRSGPGGVLVKVIKPDQERRVDLPTIGPITVQNAAASGLQGIAVEKDSVFVVDEEELVQTANRLGLFVVGIDPCKL